METKKETNTTLEMQLNILVFGIAKDIVGGNTLTLQIHRGATVGELKQVLLNQFPVFEKLTSLAIGLNSEYATDDLILKASDEIVIIPPVSGG